MVLSEPNVLWLRRFPAAERSMSEIWSVITAVWGLAWGGLVEITPTAWAYLPLWLQNAVIIAGTLAALAAHRVLGRVRFAPSRTKWKRVPFTRSQRTAIKDRLYAEQRGKCVLCSRRFPKDIFEIDHIMPVARGGGNDIRNLQILCPPCNRRKGAR